MSTTTIERRESDRRTDRRFVLRWPERRTGLDRRRPPHPVLQVLSYHDRVFLLLIVFLNVLNVADLVLTSHELALGAAEANPFMRLAFETGPPAAITLKVGVVLGVSVAMWMMRRYAKVLQLALGATAVYSGLLVYHVVGLATLLPGMS